MIDFVKECHFTFALLSQAEVWFPDGRPRMRISEMTESHRRNTARFLLRRAAQYAIRFDFGETAAITAPVPDYLGDIDGKPVYSRRFVDMAPDDGTPAGDAFDEMLERKLNKRLADPQSWMRTTPLFQALVDGLGEVTA